jgi:2-dehydropantoate 2-reductase
MRVVVVGAGGVGGVIGGLLARSGVEVAFVARGAQLAALRERGLTVESPRASFRLERVEASDDPSALAPADVVLVAVKAWQVAEVAPRLAPLVARGGFVVPLENGVEAADALARALGEDRVVGGLGHFAVWLEGPGKARHVGELLRVTMGERRGGSSPRLEALAGLLRAAKVDVVLSPDIEAASWEKFLFNAAFGGVGAVTRAPVGVVRSIPETRALLAAAMEEIAAVARARGVRIASDAVTRALATIDAFPPEVTASMQRDIQAGRPSELFDQNGAVVRMGKEAGVRVPVNEVILGALLPQEQAARRGAAA